MTTYATEVRPTLFGIVLALYPSDLRAYLEIQRAPDSGGSPDTGNAEIIGAAAPGQQTFTDLRSSGTWHYRIRHIRSGATSSSWTDWVAATPRPIPSELPQIPEVGGWIIKQGRLESTDGSIVLDAPNENIRIGAATSPTNGIGIFQGLDGVNPDKYDWRVGDPNGQQAWWDHSEGVLRHTGILESNGIRYGPLEADGTVHSTGVTSTETTLKTVTVPAGVMGATGGVRITCGASLSKLGSSGTLTLRIYFGGTAVAVAAETLSDDVAMVRIDCLVFNYATGQQSVAYSVASDTSAATSDGGTISVDTTSDVDITITTQHSASGSTTELRPTLVELLASAPT